MELEGVKGSYRFAKKLGDGLTPDPSPKGEGSSKQSLGVTPELGIRS